MVSINGSEAVVVFVLDDRRFALSMHAVERVVRAVEVVPLPDAPPGVLGLVNVHGRIMPVFDVRPRFGLPSREVRVSDHLLIARTTEGEVAVLVDAALDVVSSAHSAVSLPLALPSIEALQGVMMQGEEIVPIQDLARFLPASPLKAPELKLAA